MSVAPHALIDWMQQRYELAVKDGASLFKCLLDEPRPSRQVEMLKSMRHWIATGQIPGLKYPTKRGRKRVHPSGLEDLAAYRCYIGEKVLSLPAGESLERVPTVREFLKEAQRKAGHSAAEVNNPMGSLAKARSIREKKISIAKKHGFEALLTQLPERSRWFGKSE